MGNLTNHRPRWDIEKFRALQEIHLAFPIGTRSRLENSVRVRVTLNSDQSQTSVGNYEICETSLLEIFPLFPSFWAQMQKKYEENMKDYEGDMKKFEKNMKKI